MYIKMPEDLRTQTTEWLRKQVPIVHSILTKSNGLILAGGIFKSILSGSKVNDIDIYCETVCWDIWEKVFDKKSDAVIRDNSYAKTYIFGDEIVQLCAITGVPISIESVLNSFDYTICQAGFSNKKAICSEYFVEHVRNKKLIPNPYRQVKDKDLHLYHTIKLLRQGFSISDEDLKEITEGIDPLYPFDCNLKYAMYLEKHSWHIPSFIN